MSEEIKEYPFEKKFDVKFDGSALKTFNDLIKEKGIRHFKLESDLYGILDVVSYEEYEKLQQKVEQLEKENKRLNNIINELEIISGNRMNTILEIEKYCNDEKEDLIAGGEVCEDILKIIDELKENK